MNTDGSAEVLANLVYSQEKRLCVMFPMFSGENTHYFNTKKDVRFLKKP